MVSRHFQETNLEPIKSCALCVCRSAEQISPKRPVIWSGLDTTVQPFTFFSLPGENLHVFLTQEAIQPGPISIRIIAFENTILFSPHTWKTKRESTVWHCLKARAKAILGGLPSWFLLIHASQARPLAGSMSRAWPWNLLTGTSGHKASLRQSAHRKSNWNKPAEDA